MLLCACHKTEQTSINMNTRRKFLFNSGMATAALIATRPFNSLAKNISPLKELAITNTKLILAHTGNALSETGIVNQITALKNSNAKLLMLHAGCTGHVEQVPFDASMHANAPCYVQADNYKIIYKNDIKTGIITASDKSSSVKNINALAEYLKKEKNCQIVLCLSQLGYRSTVGLNDLALAETSTHLDVIIGGHATNFCKRPVIALNKNKEEVIINHAAADGLAFRKIEIGFDADGIKNHVAFTKTC